MNFFRLALSFLCLCLCASAVADGFPNQPIRLINPYAPGGTADIVSRTIAGPLGQILGTSVVVENKGGAGGAIGTSEMARAKADGYTLAVATVGSMVVIPITMPQAGYTRSDLAPIMNIAATPNVIAVNPSFPAQNAQEFLSLLKENPGKYSFASSGVGGINHMLGETFQALSGTELVHIPYRGSGPALSDVLAGQVPILVDQLASSKPHIEAGRLRLIGVIGPKRLSEFPDVPTFAELGLAGFDDQAWYGLIAPHDTPNAILEKINSAMRQVLTKPEVQNQLKGAGTMPIGNSPAEFAAQVKSESDSLQRLIKTRHIVLNNN